MMTTHRQRIERLDGSRPLATYVRHVRTLTSGGRNDDVDLYRLGDGTEIECISDAGDARDVARECDLAADHYPGHRPGA
jgi:hypothetical protein